MSAISPPARCLLCNAPTGIVRAGFHQEYAQKDLTPVFLDWWECHACKGWFVHPVPTPEVIEQHWGVIDYNQQSKAIELARAKCRLQQKILEELSRLTTPGPLLDFGCNFGDFLLMARDAGWTPCGFEPYRGAAEGSRARGFDVRDGWLLEEAGFDEGTYTAVTANDAFCFAWSPIDTLRTFHRLLKPGGILVMRLTNKRFILGVVRAFSQPGPSRDAKISKILKAQFHSIGVAAFRRILACVGFEAIQIQPGALTAPWPTLSWQTQAAYLGASILYSLSLKAVNLSPGILLFARKSIG